MSRAAVAPEQSGRNGHTRRGARAAALRRRRQPWRCDAWRV